MYKIGSVYVCMCLCVCVFLGFHWHQLHLVNVLSQPAETFTVALTFQHWAHIQLQWAARKIGSRNSALYKKNGRIEIIRRRTIIPAEIRYRKTKKASRFLLFRWLVDTSQRNCEFHLHWLHRAYQFCCLRSELDNLTTIHPSTMNPIHFYSLGNVNDPRHLPRIRLHLQPGSSLSIHDALVCDRPNRMWWTSCYQLTIPPMLLIHQIQMHSELKFKAITKRNGTQFDCALKTYSDAMWAHVVPVYRL